MCRCICMLQVHSRVLDPDRFVVSVHTQSVHSVLSVEHGKLALLATICSERKVEPARQQQCLWGHETECNSLCWFCMAPAMVH